MIVGKEGNVIVRTRPTRHDLVRVAPPVLPLHYSRTRPQFSILTIDNRPNNKSPLSQHFQSAQLGNQLLCVARFQLFSTKANGRTVHTRRRRLRGKRWRWDSGCFGHGEREVALGDESWW